VKTFFIRKTFLFNPIRGLILFFLRGTMGGVQIQLLTCPWNSSLMHHMKTTKVFLAVAVVSLATMSNGFCKPGGWFFDLLDRSTISINSGYSQPTYYRPAPVYYCEPVQVYRPAPVYYEPRVIYAPPRPVYYNAPSYNSSSSFFYQGSRCR
jgi:hypothetical protein